MIYELATLNIDPDKATEFEAAVAKAAPLFKAAKGCHAMSLEKVIENTGQYILRVKWENLDAHIIDFRNSENFLQWRALAGPFFISPPSVIHSEIKGDFF